MCMCIVKTKNFKNKFLNKQYFATYVAFSSSIKQRAKSRSPFLLSSRPLVTNLFRKKIPVTVFQDFKCSAIYYKIQI